VRRQVVNKLRANLPINCRNTFISFSDGKFGSTLSHSSCRDLTLSPFRRLQQGERLLLRCPLICRLLYVHFPTNSPQTKTSREIVFAFFLKTEALQLTFVTDSSASGFNPLQLLGTLSHRECASMSSAFHNGVISTFKRDL